MFNIDKIKTRREAFRYLEHFYFFENGDHLVEAYLKLPEKIKEDEKIATWFLLFTKGSSYTYLPNKLKENFLFHLYLIEKYPFLLEKMPETYKNNSHLVHKAVSSNGYILHFIQNQKILDNKEIILKAVQNNGCFLAYASERLRNDLDVVSHALHKNIESICFIGQSFLENPSLLFLRNPWVFLDGWITFSKNEILQKIKNNLKNKKFLICNSESLFPNKYQWNHYLNIIDKSIGVTDFLTLDYVMRESFSSLDVFIPYWNMDSIKRLKDFSDENRLNKSLKNPNILTMMDDYLTYHHDYKLIMSSL
jgi:hypothetical protein